MKNVSSVALPPYSSELPNCLPNFEIAVAYACDVKVSLNPSLTEPDDTDVRNIWTVGTMKKKSSHRIPGARSRYGVALRTRSRNPRPGASRVLATAATRSPRHLPT